jgi:hypothetical protein
VRSFLLPTSAYILAALVFVTMALLGWHEEGFSGVWHFVFVASLALAQAIRPTLFGWRLLFLLFAVYALVASISLLSHPDGDHIVFALMGVLPAIMLYACRPPRHVRDKANESSG